MENDVRNLLQRIGQSELAYLEHSVPANLEVAAKWAGISGLLQRLEDQAEDFWPLALPQGQ